MQQSKRLLTLISAATLRLRFTATEFANQVLKTDGSGALSWVDQTTAYLWRQR